MAKVPQPIREGVGASRQGLRWTARAVRHASRSHAEPGPSLDVWRWTRRKYRVRAVVLLLINAVLFAGLGAFTYWLRTGLYNPFATHRYWEIWWAAFDPTREQQITLIDYLLYPIPVEQVPLMMVIVGLVLASLTAIPILVSMLYRLPFALIFTAIIAFVAVVPWLAIVVTLCCLLVRWRPLQFSFRYATALISLLPLVVYYAGATRNASISGHFGPMEAARLYLPWGLAVIAACVAIAIVLLIARLVNYRPGAIAPLLAVMFAVPVVLFEAQVGRDELYYRLLESEYGPGSRTHFTEFRDVEETLADAAREYIDYRDDDTLTVRSVMDQLRIPLQIKLASGRGEGDAVLRHLGGRFTREREEATQASRRFRDHYPASRYIPNALYLEGRAIDMRMDPRLALVRDTLHVQHYQDFPNAASRPVWRELHERFPDSLPASVAALHLAMFEARSGQVDHAVALLDELIRRSAGQAAEEAPPAGGGIFSGTLAKRPAASSLDVDRAAVVQRAEKLRYLLAQNRDPDQNDLALQRLLGFDPHHAGYRQNLRRLWEESPSRHPRTLLRDNVKVLLATAQSSSFEKAERLRGCIDELGAESDAYLMACYELGVVYQSERWFNKAREVFEQALRPEVKRHHPESPWIKEIERRLAAMAPPAEE
jgi:hypothetical protein